MQIFKSNLWALMLTDAAISVIMLWIAVSIRNESWFVPTTAAGPQIGFALFGAPFVLYCFGCYRSFDISPSYQNVLMLAKATSVFGALFLAATLYLHPTGVPRSVGLIFPLMLLAIIIASRLVIDRLVRLLDGVIADIDRKKIYIYGAGQAGKSILAFLRNQPWIVEAFLDDDVAKIGRVFHHIKIKDPLTLGPANSSDTTTVLLALPSIDGARRAEIYGYLNDLGFEVLTIPTLAQMAFGGSKFAELREVRIEDLLERAIVSPDSALMERGLKDKAVLVTGAGGSIGSELSRQILRLGAGRLIMLDHSEFHLFEIDRQLSAERNRSGASCDIVPVLGSICLESDVAAIFDRYAIDTVFHAAAYKHVHLLEKNEFKGLYNNIIGTKLIVSACLAHGVQTMVLVSTDKAVRPTSVMGISKRVAELIVEEARINQVDGETKFATVRFGNVLGSNGSVIPIFEEQIAKGGPVTVTDQSVTRYFMTIQEASSLVIQAGAMTHEDRGVFVLDMGDPVPITLLAERLIEMAGRRPTYDTPKHAGEIQVIFTGLKLGEKLHEDLFISKDKPRPTSHPRIFYVESCWPPDNFADKLTALYEALQSPEGANAIDWGSYLDNFLGAVDG